MIPVAVQCRWALLSLLFFRHFPVWDFGSRLVHSWLERCAAEWAVGQSSWIGVDITCVVFNILNIPFCQSVPEFSATQRRLYIPNQYTNHNRYHCGSGPGHGDDPAELPRNPIPAKQGPGNWLPVGRGRLCGLVTNARARPGHEVLMDKEEVAVWKGRPACFQSVWPIVDSSDCSGRGQDAVRAWGAGRDGEEHRGCNVRCINGALGRRQAAVDNSYHTIPGMDPQLDADFILHC